MNEFESLLAELSSQGLTVGSVESLTGGLFGEKMTSIPGASAVYKGGVISYDPSVKVNLVGVRQSVIDSYGIVSSPVATEMAFYGEKKLGVDICLSCTGNAGPSVQEGGEPVGCVYVGASYHGYVYSLPLQFEGDRQMIREATVLAMANLALSLIKKN